MTTSSQYALSSPESNFVMPPCVPFSKSLFLSVCEVDIISEGGRLSAPVGFPHLPEAKVSRNGQSWRRKDASPRLPLSYNQPLVPDTEQILQLAVLESELRQLIIANTPLARSVAPRLRMLRLIASRNEVIYTHPKAHWYKMKGWREVLECGHEHHVYQVEDLTAKRRNCPTCAKAAQLQNASELIRTLEDSTSTVGRCCAADAESQENRGGLIEAQLTTGTDGNRACLGSAPSALDKSQVLTPPKQPSQSVLRHKEKSA